MPFAAMWMELEGIMLSEISQSETDIIYFHSYVELEKLNRRPWGKGRGKKQLQREREGGKPQETLKYREQTEGGWGREENG